MARESLLRKFAKAALDAGMDVELSWKADAAARLASLVTRMAIADLLWSPPDRLPLYKCVA